MPTRKQTCKTCAEEGLPLTRPAPFPGPRCATHHRARRKAASAARHIDYVTKTYGVDYDALLASQGGVCALCGKPPVRKRLSVDHDHRCCPGSTSCGKCVRGLVHAWENTILGRIRDSIQWLSKAIEYLTNPPAQAGSKDPS